MKTLILTITFAAAFCGAAQAQNVAQRQQNERQRIAQGARSGELTKGETAALSRQQQSIHNQVARDRRDGGGLTAAERARARHRLDNASRDIYKLKHNRRTR